MRLHVERVISLLCRKYATLQSTLPTDYLTSSQNGPPETQVPIIDSIIRVCSALVNFCPPIVPFDWFSFLAYEKHECSQPTDSDNKKFTQEMFTKWLDSGNDMIRGKMCLSQPHQMPFWHYCSYLLLFTNLCSMHQKNSMLQWEM